MESLLFLAEKALDSKDFSNDFDVECLILARSKLISLCNCKFGGDISSEFNNLLSNNDEESFFLLDYLVRRCSSKPTVFSLVSDNLDIVLSIYDRHLSAELSRFVTAILSIKFGDSDSDEDAVLDKGFKKLSRNDFCRLLDYSICTNNYLSDVDLVDLVERTPAWVVTLYKNEIKDLEEKLNRIILEDTFCIFLFNSIYNRSDISSKSVRDIETKRNVCIKHNLNIMDQDYYKKVKEGVLCDKEIGR